MTRDPIGYEGSEWNLYEYVYSDPLLFSDPYGKFFFLSGCSGPSRRKPDTCCRDAARLGLSAGDGGGVVCCDGRKVSCSWQPSQGNTKGDSIINECTLRHEDDHHDDILACPKTIPSLTRPPFAPGKSRAAEECKAYQVELDCLRRRRKKCKGSPSCDLIVGDRIRQIEGPIGTRYGCTFR